MAGDPAAEARAALEAAGRLPDAELGLAAVALQFARIDAPEADWRGAATAISALVREAVRGAAEDPRTATGDPEPRRALLARLLHGEHGFAGDTARYDDPRNANLIRVVERRRGLPVALGILWLEAAEAIGWHAHGVDFPGHFLIAIEAAKGPLLVDVFHGGRAMSAPELRALIKRVEGAQAELRPGLLRAMDKRAVVLRLQNNIKLRRLGAGELGGALACTEDMLRLAPDHAALWREAGLMRHRLDRVTSALAAFERALALEPEGEAAARIRGLAEELRGRLN